MGLDGKCMVRTLRSAPSLVIARWSAQTGTRHWCHPDVRPRRQARCRLLPIPLRRMRLVSLRPYESHGLVGFGVSDGAPC